MVSSSRKLATFDDIAHAESERLEIIAGEIIEKAAPSASHALVETKVGALVDPFNRRSGGSRGPGGWWVLTEIHVQYGTSEVYCHDVAGWRRERVPERPTGWPVTIRPDWVCEIVSPNHEKHDLVVKPRVLHAAAVPHYWVIDPEERILLVHRWAPDGYTVVLRATAGETVRPEPFDAIEISVGELFGEDE